MSVTLIMVDAVRFVTIWLVALIAPVTITLFWIVMAELAMVI